MKTGGGLHTLNLFSIRNQRRNVVRSLTQKKALQSLTSAVLVYLNRIFAS